MYARPLCSSFWEPSILTMQKATNAAKKERPWRCSQCWKGAKAYLLLLFVCYFMFLINNRGLERTSLRVVGVNILVPNTAFSQGCTLVCIPMRCKRTCSTHARTSVRLRVISIWWIYPVPYLHTSIYTSKGRNCTTRGGYWNSKPWDFSLEEKVADSGVGKPACS